MVNPPVVVKSLRLSGKKMLGAAVSKLWSFFPVDASQTRVWFFQSEVTTRCPSLENNAVYKLVFPPLTLTDSRLESADHTLIFPATSPEAKLFPEGAMAMEASRKECPLNDATKLLFCRSQI